MAHRKGRKRHAVVFLDADISSWIYEYLYDLRQAVHWVTFDAPRKTSRHVNPNNPIAWRKLKRFYDLVGDHNISRKNGIKPQHMKDDNVLSYMALVIEERYPYSGPYFFYTHDKRFFTQPMIREHPLRRLLGTKIICIQLDTPKEKSTVLTMTARAIREDLEKRLELEYVD